MNGFRNLFLLRIKSDFTRRYSTRANIKRFYKEVSISESSSKNGSNCYEINLDRKKLKTPNGTLFLVPSEGLALAIANEWDSQNGYIKRHNMHLTTLMNIAIDNPTYKNKDETINSILEFLYTDTICYRINEPDELIKYQNDHWNPIIDWVEKTYQVEINLTCGFNVPVTDQETKLKFRQYLNSFNSLSLFAFQQSSEILKSFLLTIALFNRVLTVEKAIFLSRLEQQYQANKWGNVEWHHDLDQLSCQTHLSAAALFLQLCNQSSKIKNLKR